MKFKTTLDIHEEGIKINHESGIILLGSCFTENIGSKLQRYKFNCLNNPFGTIFHPIPMAWLIEKSIEKSTILKDDLIYNESLYFHDQFHYSFSSPNLELALEKMNLALREFYIKIKSANFIFFSFGSAIGYNHKEKNRIVANCHKLDPINFDKQFSTLKNLYEKWDKLINKLQSFNPDLHIIFTISPVRHIRDGIINSSRSKALLQIFTHQLIESHLKLHYFPSYELLMDDLRDYRFYTDDLVHPGNLAIEYIWEGFTKAYLSGKTKGINLEIERIIKARDHRFQHDITETKKVFGKLQLERIKKLLKNNPKMDFREEQDYFQSLI